MVYIATPDRAASAGTTSATAGFSSVPAGAPVFYSPLFEATQVSIFSCVLPVQELPLQSQTALLLLLLMLLLPCLAGFFSIVKRDLPVCQQCNAAHYHFISATSHHRPVFPTTPSLFNFLRHCLPVLRTSFSNFEQKRSNNAWLRTFP